ncbi:TPA: hypothetical protein ACKQIK_004881 [Pseudomonas aeruginosa]
MSDHASIKATAKAVEDMIVQLEAKAEDLEGKASELRGLASRVRETGDMSCAAEAAALVILNSVDADASPLVLAAKQVLRAMLDRSSIGITQHKGVS